MGLPTNAFKKLNEINYCNLAPIKCRAKLNFGGAEPGDVRQELALQTTSTLHRPLRKSWEAEGWGLGRGGGTFLQKGPSSPLPTSTPPSPKTFDVIESLFAAFSGLRSRRRAFPHDARLMRFLHVTGCMLQKKPVHFVKMYWL